MTIRRLESLFDVASDGPSCFVTHVEESRRQV